MKHLLLLTLLIPVLCTAQMKRTVGKYSATDYYLRYAPTTLQIKGSILAMDGSGEIGTDSSSLVKLEAIELGKLFKAGKEVPYVVYIPMLLKPKSNWPADAIIRMLTIIDGNDTLRSLVHHVTGLSLGANGAHVAMTAAYELNNNRPGYFKTCAPLASGVGYGSVTLPAYTMTKVRMYHGTKDTTVPITNDLKLLPVLQAAGIDVSYLWYEGYTHNVWSEAYKLDYWQFLESVDGKAEPKVLPGVVRIKISANTPFVVE